MLKVNGVDLPAPIKIGQPQFDLDSENSGRNQLGVNKRDRIRSNIFKLELEWKFLSSSDLQVILAAIEPAAFNVTFPYLGGNITKNVYAGDRNIELALYHKEPDQRQWHLSCNFIEN